MADSPENATADGFAESEVVSRLALALDPHSPHPKCTLGIVLAREGRFTEAIAQFNDALRLAPDHPVAHAHLGAAYVAIGDIDRGAHHCRRALALDRKNHEAAVNLGMTCLARGDLKQAIELALYAFDIGDSPQARDLFGRAAPYVWSAADDARFRRILTRALAERWVRPRLLMRPAVSIIKSNTGIRAAMGLRPSSGAPQEATTCYGVSEIAQLANDTVLRELLCATALCDDPLEQALSSLRRCLLDRAIHGATSGIGEELLTLFCVLAQQCFINEYVYPLAADERSRVETLRDRLAEALARDDNVPTLWLPAVGAYRPLHALAHAQRLSGRTWPEPVAALVRQQVQEPNEQAALRAALPRLTDVDDAISLRVQRQYEDNPYPRWIAAGVPQRQSLDAYLAAKFPRVPFRPLGKARLEILNAGCGTGQHAIETARRFIGAEVLAIDLSATSLAYALFKAREIGVMNIRFAIADILKFDGPGRSFDVIEAQGVLHHMADPFSAWRRLLSMLRPGGLMSLGLYSERAREPIARARAFIAGRGYEATIEGIRACRRELAQSGDPLLRYATERTDFYTVSECRDLLFHVHEHCLTLPQIAAFLAGQKLTFLGFDIEPGLSRLYAQRFPDDFAKTDLGFWHRFEAENPQSFAGMYRFWIQKP